MKLLETDEYGRSLFMYYYWLWGFATTENNYASLLIICQSSSGKKKTDLMIGYYDECWLAKPSTAKEYASFDDTEIAQLKEQNDWGKPIDETKINTVHYYTYSSCRTKEERVKYRENQAKYKANNSVFVDAMNMRFMDNKAVGPTVYRQEFIYSVVVISDVELYFVCFDLSNKTIVREEHFDGSIFDCRDAYIGFLNQTSEKDL